MAHGLTKPLDVGPVKLVKPVAKSSASSFFKSKREKIQLTAANTYIFNQDMNPSSADGFLHALIGKRVLLDIQDKNATLYLVIVSGGGQYETALGMKEALSHIPNVVVICKYCASAAGFLFATAKSPRYVIDKSILMMHEMYLPVVTAKIAKNKAVLDNLMKSSDDFDKAMYSIIGISKEEYEKKITNTQWDVQGDEIVKLHLADKIVDVACDQYVNNMAPDTCSQ